MIASIVGAILGALNPISKITGQIADAKIAAIHATTDKEKVASEERARALEARRDVLIAEGSFTRLNVFMRFALAFGPMLYLNKIFIWDKVLKLGATDPLKDDNLWAVVIAVVSFYFLYDIAARWKR